MLVSYMNCFVNGVYIRIPINLLPNGEFMKADTLALSLSSHAIDGAPIAHSHAIEDSHALGK